jgi:hypothetical protein
LIAVITIWLSHRQFRKTLKSRVVEDERKEIYKKLNDFYGPLLQLRKKSEKLYRLFSKRLGKEGENFRTLNHLLEGKEMTENEKVLLEEIIKIGEKCEDLIHQKSGLIDDRELRNNILPRLTTHLLIIRIAFEGKLKNHTDEFNDLAFPREVDDLLEEKIQHLQKRLKELNRI